MLSERMNADLDGQWLSNYSAKESLEELVKDSDSWVLPLGITLALQQDPRICILPKAPRYFRCGWSANHTWSSSGTGAEPSGAQTGAQH